MANHKLLIPFIKEMEGGYVNDPYDQGGETNKGITIATWRAAGYDTSIKIPSVTLKKWNGQLVTYRNVTKSLYGMTDVQWEHVYKTMYWDRWQADLIRNQSIANILVDWVWASGYHGIMQPQKILGVNPDAVVGFLTLNALNYENQRQLFAQIKNARITFVEDIVRRKPNQARYLNAWKRRINALSFSE